MTSHRERIATAEKRQNEYNEMLNALADSIICAVDLEDEMEVDGLLTREKNEYCGEHEWASDENRCFQILQCAKNPSAEVFNHGSSGYTPNRPTDIFPFNTFAVGALEADAQEQVEKLLKEKSPDMKFHDESSLREAIRIYQGG